MAAFLVAESDFFVSRSYFASKVRKERISVIHSKFSEDGDHRKHSQERRDRQMKKPSDDFRKIRKLLRKKTDEGTTLAM